MGDVFLLKLSDKATLEESARLFGLEQQQFSQKLPMYAQKEEFLAALLAAQCIVLKGGTGIGQPCLPLTSIGALAGVCHVLLGLYSFALHVSRLGIPNTAIPHACCIPLL